MAVVQGRLRPRPKTGTVRIESPLHRRKGPLYAQLVANGIDFQQAGNDGARLRGRALRRVSGFHAPGTYRQKVWLCAEVAAGAELEALQRRAGTPWRARLRNTSGWRSVAVAVARSG
jgi:hypothetical protein